MPLSAVVVTCSLLPIPTNGHRLSSRRNYNDRVSFSCNTGYNLRGSSSRTCLSTAQWSGTQPTCDSKWRVHYDVSSQRHAGKLITIYNNWIHFSSNAKESIALLFSLWAWGFLESAIFQKSLILVWFQSWYHFSHIYMYIAVQIIDSKWAVLRPRYASGMEEVESTIGRIMMVYCKVWRSWSTEARSWEILWCPDWHRSISKLTFAHKFIVI